MRLPNWRAITHEDHDEAFFSNVGSLCSCRSAGKRFHGVGSGHESRTHHASRESSANQATGKSSARAGNSSRHPSRRAHCAPDR